MSRLARIMIVAIPLALVILLFLWSRADAQSPDEIIQRVLSQSTKLNGATIVPLGVPQNVLTEFQAFAALPGWKLASGVDLKTLFSANEAIYSIAAGSNKLSLLAVPIADSANAQLSQSNVTIDGQAGKIIGATYDPTRSSAALYPSLWVYFPAAGSAREQLSVYTADGKPIAGTVLIHRTFTPVAGSAATTSLGNIKPPNPKAATAMAAAAAPPPNNPSAPIVPGDAGSVVAARETCMTVGLDQICLQTTPQNREAVARVTAAANSLAAVYKFDVSLFDLNGSVSELFGSDQRTKCQAAIQVFTLSSDTLPPTCPATLAFTARADVADPDRLLNTDQPLAVFSLSQDVALSAAADPKQSQVYDAKTGRSVPLLPKGDYLVSIATPKIGLGDPGLVLLRSADGVSAYLIPCKRVEGFGTPSAATPNLRTQAAVKEGLTAPVGLP